MSQATDKENTDSTLKVRTALVCQNKAWTSPWHLVSVCWCSQCRHHQREYDSLYDSAASTKSHMNNNHLQRRRVGGDITCEDNGESMSVLSVSVKDTRRGDWTIDIYWVKHYNQAPWTEEEATQPAYSTEHTQIYQGSKKCCSIRNLKLSKCSWVTPSHCRVEKTEIAVIIIQTFRRSSHLAHTS